MKHKEQKQLRIILAIVLIGVLFLGLEAGLHIKEKKQYKLIYISKTEEMGNQFWTSVLEGATMAAKEYGIDLTVLSPDNEEEYERQNELIAQAIKERPDAILVAPCSYTENTKMLKKVKEAGIKLVMIDSIVDQNIGDLVVATDNQLAANNLGKYAAGYLEKGDEIVIVEHVKGASTALDRQNGFTEGLGDKAVGIQEVVYSGSIYKKAYDLTSQMIKKYPNLKMIVGLNEPSAVGAAKAIQDNKKQDQITMIGFDNSTEEIQLMEEGIFKGIVIQKPFNMGYMSVQQTFHLLNGKKVEKNMDSGAKLITIDNLYTEENQKLLFPFSGGNN